MSNLIVFDMEWNMGYKPKTFVYHGAEQVLRGEVIQIGAVKMEGQEIRDTFRVTMRPRIFRKLHHRVSKITGLTQQDINAGLPIARGLEQFRAWCGKDAVLGEWGLDDVPVLKQNLFLAGLDESWPRQWYDLQRVYASQSPEEDGSGMSLETMVERLGIEKDDAFHDALADAMYTAKVMQHVNIRQGLDAYPDGEALMRELLCPEDRQRRDFVCWRGFPDGDEWLENREMHRALCPECGRPLTPDVKDLWLKHGNNCMYSLGLCPEHGPVMIWLRRSCSDGLHYLFARATEKADPVLQTRWENGKKAAQRRERREQEQKEAEEKAAHRA